MGKEQQWVLRKLLAKHDEALFSAAYTMCGNMFM